MPVNNINKHKAFTLVELLVTISIIGLLTSIVLVVVKDKTPKADIAKTMQWSRSIESLLGAYAVGIWNFDEGTGTTATDLSGYGNDGTLMNNPTWRCAEDDSSYTPSGHGCALEFDGADDYVEISDPVTLLGMSGLTISYWMNPVSLSGDWQYALHYHLNITGTIIGTSAIWGGLSSSNNINLTINANEASDSYNAGDTEIRAQVGIWYYVLATWDGSNVRVYVNGDEKTSYLLNSLSEGNSSLWLGRNPHISNRQINAKLDNIRIYETALTSAQIEALYYVGLDNLYSKGKIDKQEYQERLLVKNK